MKLRIPHVKDIKYNLQEYIEYTKKLQTKIDIILMNEKIKNGDINYSGDIKNKMKEGKNWKYVKSKRIYCICNEECWYNKNPEKLHEYNGYYYLKKYFYTIYYCDFCIQDVFWN